MEKLKLIKAKEVDKDFLFDLRKATMVEHLEKAGIYLSDEEHLSRIDLHYDSTYLVLRSNKKAGMLKYIETENTIEIAQLQILPEYQGKGIGRYLIKDLARKAEASNKILTLKVLKENPAKVLYERCGFSITGKDTYEFHMQLVSDETEKK